MAPGEFDPQSYDPSVSGETSGGEGDLLGNSRDSLMGDSSGLAPELMPTFRDPISGEIVSESGASSSEFAHPAGRYVQPELGDEFITHIPPIDAVIDRVEQFSDTLDEFMEDATPVVQEMGREVASQARQIVESATERWNDTDNQWRAGLEQDISNIKDSLGRVMNSDLVQNGVAGAGRLAKSFVENLQAWQYDLKNLQDQVAPTLETLLDVASGTNEDAFGASSSLPEEAFSFNDKLFIWTRYVIKQGDNLSQLSLDTTGDGSVNGSNLLAQRNGIQNPDLIYPGQEIEIPLEISNSAPLTQVGNSQGQSSQEINGFVVEDEFLSALETWNLGTPVSEVKTHQSGAQFQYFEKSGLGLLSVVSSEHGAFPLWGGVRDYYVNVTRGLNGPLGAPTSAEKGIGDGAVKQEFEHGYITWKAGVAQAFDSDGELLFQQPVDIPSSPNSSSGGTASEALLDVVGADYFLNRSQYYTTGNIFAQSGYGSSLVNGTGSTEGNCTWYAHGRVLEMGGEPAALRSMNGNANEWHTQLSNGSRILGANELPQRGDIAQWTRNGMNHVAVVEEVYQQEGQTRIKISESHYYGADGGGNGILHSVKDYTASNPDRFIRVPGVQQVVQELQPVEQVAEQPGSYEVSFNADIYDEPEPPKDHIDYWRSEKAIAYMHNEMLENVESAEANEIRFQLDLLGRFDSHSDYLSLISASSKFIEMVETNGPWDHKPILNESLGLTGFDGKMNPPNDVLGDDDFYFPILGDSEHEYFYDVWSNVHYGFVGASVGFPLEYLQLGAGTTLGFNGVNDAYDEAAVEIGFELWEKYGSMLWAFDREDLAEAILRRGDELNRIPLVKSDKNQDLHGGAAKLEEAQPDLIGFSSSVNLEETT